MNGARSTVREAGLKPWMLMGLLVLMTLTVYSPVLKGGFIWDDDWYITQSGLTRSPEGLVGVWITTHTENYWPLTSNVFWLEWRLWMMNAGGYHTVNVLFHALNACLLFGILRRLTVRSAWLVALLFAVHPVNVSTAAWISETKNTLSMAFYLLSILAYLRFEANPRPAAYWLSLGLFLLGLLTKTSIVMLPVVLLLLAWWQRGRITAEDVRRSVPFFALAIAMGLVGMWYVQNRPLDPGWVRDDVFPARLAGAGWIPWFYASKVLLPLNLCMIYPVWKIDAARWIVFLPGALLVIVLMVFWFFRREWGRAGLMGIGYFVITLIPVLGFIDMAYMKVLVADRWQYVSMIGVLALVVSSLSALYERAGLTARRMMAILTVLVVAGLSLLTLRWSAIYADAEKLYRTTLAENPRAWTMYNALGVILKDRGQLAEAEACFKKNIELRPDDFKAHNNLGLVYAARGRNREAAEEYKRAFSIQPDFVTALFNLGNIKKDEGNPEEAIRYYRRGLSINPASPPAHFRLGRYLAEQGKLDEAIAHYRAAVALLPDYVEAWIGMGNALEARGSQQDAISCYRSALKADPNNPDARIHWGNLLAAQGDIMGAIKQYREVLRRVPDFPVALNNLAWFLAVEKDPKLRNADEAVRLAEKAVPLLEKNDPSVLGTLAAAYAAAGRFHEAVETTRRQMAGADHLNETGLVKELNRRMALYEADQMYCEPE